MLVGVARVGGMEMFRFLRRKANRWLLLLAAVDMVLLGFSLNAAMYLRYFNRPADLAQFSHHMPERSLAFAVIMLLAMVALGHYQSHRSEERRVGKEVR